jgi:putative phage-type endonuclease
MIKVLIEQDSEAWHQLRLGRITATRFRVMMSDTSTKGYKDLITELAGEILTGQSEETYMNDVMRRGKELEPEARAYYADIFGDVEQVGICLPDEGDEFHEWIGISPDGLTDGVLEIKCPMIKAHLNYIEGNRLPAEYRWQVMAQLYVTGLPYCDFMSYYPGLKPFIIRVYPDDEAFGQITERLQETILKVKSKIETYNKYDYDQH